jgi:hypothetical protein
MAFADGYGREVEPVRDVADGVDRLDAGARIGIDLHGALIV